MAQKGPPAPTPKPVRKPATQIKANEPSKKTYQNKTPQRLPLHWNQEQ